MKMILIYYLMILTVLKGIVEIPTRFTKYKEIHIFIYKAGKKRVPFRKQKTASGDSFGGTGIRE
jgi:hypothetical protein